MRQLTVPLVGRDDELALLRDALVTAREGRGRTLLLAGAGGIGKTRLALTLADHAARSGWNVALGRAYPVETGVPYAPFADALVPLLRRLEPGALAVLTRGATAELSQLFPALHPRDEPPTPAARGGSAELKARVLWNFSEFLGRFAARQPLLLILENLQYADASSLELLHFVARQLGAQRVLILGTYNDSERDGNPTLRATEQSLLSIGAAVTHTVRPLGKSAVDELLRRMFGAIDTALGEFAALLYGWTRGNPFFIEETLKSLVSSGALQERAGTWHGWQLESLELPSSIRDALLARLDRLSPAARSVAELAAVIGTRAAHDILRSVSGLEPAALVTSIDELRHAHVFEESDEGAIVYDFAHPMMRDAAYGALGLARARVLHGRIAEALEMLYGARASAHAPELGYHYARSAARELQPKAAAYLVAAGRQALERGANREAAMSLAAALDVIDSAGGDAAIDSQATLVTDLARARQRLGEYSAAEALWHRARKDAERRSEYARMATCDRQLGLGEYWRGRFKEALEHYDRGLEVAARAGDDAATVRLRVARGICLQALGRPAEGRAELERALGIAGALHDPLLLARAHRTLLLYFLWAGETERARAHAQETLVLAERGGQHLLAWSAHWALAVLAGLTGNAAEMSRHLRECDRLVEALRSPIARVWTAELELHYRWATGDWNGALALAERTIALTRSLQQRSLLPRILTWTAIVHCGRGETEIAKRYLDEAWQLAGGAEETPHTADQLSLVQVYTGLTTYHTTLGEWQEAIRYGEAGLALADRTGYVVWAVYRLIPALVEGYLRLVNLERAAELGARLRADSERLGHTLGIAWADATEALIAPLRGDIERSVELLTRAVKELDAVPFVPDAARLRRELARRKAQTGDRDGALRDLREAHDVLTRLGARLELEGAREQLRELGARPPVRPQGEGAAGLTRREAEIAAMVAQRKSNKDIARALRISPRTVSTHLSNIFGKLGVQSRGELTDYARKAGLSSEVVH
ncbi:MAG TPA: AAA family ATPase [Gemmatimonadaceae bacterium]|nr:AAA family ATPase [Gemmatimonadaceae bacterium]